MAAGAGFMRRFIRTSGSVKTGIFLLIAVVLVSALGTMILQRPLTSPAKMEQSYSPATLRFLDATGLTNVYHAWWFILLLALVGLSIVFASIERWPNAWRYYERPYRKPEAHFRAAHPTKAEFAVRDTESGLAAADKAMRNAGLRPARIREGGEVSLYAEKNRFAVLAVYIVHASLLLIFLGGILDGIFGYKGYVELIPGMPAVNQVELSDKTTKPLPFSLRCDGAGQENYTGRFAGMPKRWWSKLVVLENGREVLRKDVAVNDPLVYKGVRFYQSGFGQSDTPAAVIFSYNPTGQPENVQTIAVKPGEIAEFNGNKLRILKFLPDAYRQDDGEVFLKSEHLNIPAAKVEITDAQGKTSNVSLLYGEPPRNTAAGYALQLADLQVQNETGLQVSHEPGQWAVWAGCVLMALGLVVSFYVVHTRVWAIVVADGKGGLNLWVGAAANKKTRETFEQQFQAITDDIANQVKPAVAREKVLTMAAAAR